MRKSPDPIRLRDGVWLCQTNRIEGKSALHCTMICDTFTEIDVSHLTPTLFVLLSHGQGWRNWSGQSGFDRTNIFYKFVA